MPTTHRQQVRLVFAEIADLPESEWSAALDRACTGDTTLRADVEALLAADRAASGFMDHPTEFFRPPAGGGGGGDGAPADYTPVIQFASERTGGGGRQIGPYKLIQLIGEGGFGSVFLAEQEKPVARTVALKIIKLGMDTRQVIARFEAERQALAMLEHPNIARVLDAGATEQGRPYFVMELVQGDPIAAYADKNKLSLRDRLELFVQVCSAVQHAHTKGIIHRDIKPSNVLVGTLDGRPAAKVIDFGVAKATDAKLTDRTLVTEHRQLIGTPEYMSPEQAEGSLDIDTRTDVYSLGVLLYELLTGSIPFDAKRLRSAAFDELRRIIREVEPPKPSTRISQSADALVNVAAARRIEPRKLGSVVRGDLDWIVMKAMEKDRARRYESAGALAADVNRYLTGEAVFAAPPSTTYRVHKFVRRNRGGVLAACLVAAALVAGLVAFSWQASIARRERDSARDEAARATANNRFIESMFLKADPSMGGSKDMTVAQLLAKASANADKTLAGQPLVQAHARALLGSAFRSLGKMDQAVVELERSLELQKAAGETDTVTTAGIIRKLGLIHMDKREYTAALPLLQQAQAILLAMQPVPAFESMKGYVDIAQAHLGLSQLPECERALNDAQTILDRTPELTPGDRAYLLSIRSQFVSASKGDRALAESLAQEIVDLQRQENENPVLLADALNNLAVIRMNAGRLDDALALYDEALRISRAELGESHQRVALILENTGNIYFRKKDLDRAQSTLEQVLKIREDVFGPDSMQTARTRHNMAAVAVERGDFDRAFDLIDAALPLFLKNTGGKTLEYAAALRLHAACLKGKGDLDAALEEFNSALSILDAVALPTSAPRLRCLQGLAEIHCAKNSYEEAEETANLALKALDPNVPEQAKWIATFQELLAKCKPTPPP